MTLPSAALVALALVLAAAVVGLLLRYGGRLPAAHPNERTLHERPVPRVGGLAIWAGALPALAVAGGALPGGLAGWLPAWLALVLVSLVDDARGVPVAARLAVHALACAWAASAMLRVAGSTLPGVVTGDAYGVALALLALALAWCANLYNFMDGSDGLAGATAVIGFGALAAGAGDDDALRVVAASVAAAAVPFLAVNAPPARLFLGDVGAVPLGFLAALLAFGGSLRGDWPLWFPALVFLPFLADATATLARRMAHGEAVWRAHRSHYYQRFHQLGAGHRGTLALYAGLTLATGLTALACLAFAPAAGAVALAAWTAALAALFAAIDYHWRRKPTMR